MAYPRRHTYMGSYPQGNIVGYPQTTQTTYPPSSSYSQENPTNYPQRWMGNHPQRNTAISSQTVPTCPPTLHSQRTTTSTPQGTSGNYPQGKRTDLPPTVVFIMGETGVGKSTFIRWATGLDAKVSNGLESCTQKVELYQIPETNVYLADSPGFGDTYRNDASILGNLDDCLADIFHDQKVVLSGVLFLHSLTDARIKGGAMRNLIMLGKLVGSSNLQKCRLVTTKLSLAARPPDEIESELRNNPNFWKPLVDKGAKMVRFKDSREDALEIIWSLLDRSSVVLKLTKETQIEGRNLEDTAAGRKIHEKIDEATKELRDEMSHLRKEHETAMAQKDRQMARHCEDYEAQLRDKMTELKRERRVLRTRAKPSSGVMERWVARVCAIAGLGYLTVASGGLLAPLTTAVYYGVEKEIQGWE